MNMKYILTTSLLLIGSFIGFVPQANSAVCLNGTAIVYGNGIFNDERDARKSKNELTAKLHAYPQASQYLAEFEFYLAYADNGGATGPLSLSGLQQLLEFSRQRQAAVDSAFWRWLGGLAVAPEWFKTMMNDLAVATNASAYIKDVDLQLQLNGDPANPNQPGYRPLLNQGKRVVIVAHSQGNFYANMVYDGLQWSGGLTTNSLGIVAVASPDSRVAGGGPYLTLNEDYIIRPIPGALPVTPPLGSSDNIRELGAATWANAAMGHDFVQWYLAGTFSRDIILNNIVMTISKLQYPKKCIQWPPVQTPTSWQKVLTHEWSTSVSLHGTTYTRRMRDDVNEMAFSARAYRPLYSWDWQVSLYVEAFDGSSAGNLTYDYSSYAIDPATHFLGFVPVHGHGTGQQRIVGVHVKMRERIEPHGASLAASFTRRDVWVNTSG
jgi:hypothetical protein